MKVRRQLIVRDQIAEPFGAPCRRDTSRNASARLLKLPQALTSFKRQIAVNNEQQPIHYGADSIRRQALSSALCRLENGRVPAPHGTHMVGVCSLCIPQRAVGRRQQLI